MTVTPRKQSQGVGDDANDLFSPRFRSVAAMAGWDEEALLLASTLVVEDTPDRQNKRPNLLNSKSPPTKRRRRAQRSPCSIPIGDLEEDSKQESKEKMIETKEMEKKTGDDEVGPPAIPCIDQLREELSCAICLEICFEPCTTPCGHSFCKKCLQSAADKCGKRCPKCRDRLIRNGRSYCTVNTVIWNTIQLLFPKEVEARKANNSNNNTSPPPTLRRRNLTTSRESENETTDRRVARRELPSQSEDAALALRLQREEFMSNQRNSLALVRANLRAMASRAAYIRRAR